MTKIKSGKLNISIAIPPSAEELITRFMSVRSDTVSICTGLEIEDYAIQPAEEVSPPKWHLGHTTWFFEELILVAFLSGYIRHDNRYRELFNSYYKAAGKHWAQGERGYLSRPTVEEVFRYRQNVDAKIVELIQSCPDNPEIEHLLNIGLHHEQQHQELLYMDIKYILCSNPLYPYYVRTPLGNANNVVERWSDFDEGIYSVGHHGEAFSFDNETPGHKTYIYPFSISENTATNDDYLAFIDAGGYSESKYWLSLGWEWVVANQIECPLYWQREGDTWFECTLHGRHRLDSYAPVTHISYFEAYAFASWKGCRLPTEHEMEIFLVESSPKHSYVNATVLHPKNAEQIVGQVWCWTKSHYSSYPGYQAYKGVLEEYNGKFMCNQFVLKAGCVATPAGHYRHTYRNFYQPHQRWMFSGIRLAKDAA